MRKRQEIRRIAASIMAAVMMVTAIPFGGTAYGNEVPRGGIVNTEDTETLTASDSNGEYKKISDSDADAKTETEAAKKEEQIALLAEDGIEGTGTEEDPFIIDSPADWVTVMEYGEWNGKYNRYGSLLGCIALDKDICLKGESWDLAALNGFTFDGRGHKIEGINQPLFSAVKGTVKNLILTDVDIKESNRQQHVGAIARQTSDTANIQNCAVMGYIENINYSVGGLVGNCQGTTNISDCIVQMEIVNTGTNQPESAAGGLVGKVSGNDYLNIERCMTLGTVNGAGRGCGGLVGGLGYEVTINQCAALQETVVTKSYQAYVGRIFGYYLGTITGSGNYAYEGMNGGYGEIFNSNAAANGSGVKKEDCLSTAFWTDTMGWSEASCWEFKDGNLPMLMTSELYPAKTLTNGKAPTYLSGVKEKLSSPGNVMWDDTAEGNAVWDAVDHASGYQLQLYKGSATVGSAQTVIGQTSYDFTSEIGETGIYKFTVKALGDKNYEDSEEEVSGEYSFTAQSLDDVKISAENMLNKMNVTNETTADKILKSVNDIITNASISAEWSEESGFTLTKATDGIEPGDNGGITGTIILTLRKEGVADETENLTVDLTILPKFTVTFKSGSETASGTAPTWESKMEGTTVTLPENPFTVYEKMFSGWKDSDGKVYSAGSAYKMPRRNVTFTAMWEHDVWDGSTKTEPKRDDNRYYLISTGAELAWFQGGTHAIGKAKLVCDIDLGYHDFVPISNSVAEFDGCGHTIHGLKAVNNGVYAGLFSNVSGACLIKDLTIKDARVKPASERSETEIGILMSAPSETVTIENCHISGSIIGSGNAYFAGGLIGHVRQSANVKIELCSADIRITGTAGNGFAGGLIGYIDGTAEINNSYAVVDMDVDYINYAGGLVGAGNNAEISNSYAAGKSLTGKWAGGTVSGIANKGTITNSVSIFPEMTSVNRISQGGTLSGNYGFVGTTARNSTGKVLTPEESKIGADQPYGADASAEQLRSQEFYQGTLKWDFNDVWTMPSAESGYKFPVLKEQKESMIPTLSLDMDPEVISVSLDQQKATLYPKGSLKLTATVESKNGASRDVIWISSDPSAVSVAGDGTVVVQEDAVADTYKITAVSLFDGKKYADSMITVDDSEHTVSIIHAQDNGNSPNAEVEVYLNKEDAENASNPSAAVASGKVPYDQPIEFTVRAGSEVYLKFKNFEPDDEVSHIRITGEDGKEFEAQPYKPDPAIYYFIMPCSDASIKVEYARNIGSYQYIWFVGQDWSTVGTTATYTTKNWANGEHIGSLEVTNIINGKKFKGFDVKSMSIYKGGVFEPQEESDRTLLTENGRYYVQNDPTGHPTLYVYLNGSGMVTVNIEVEDDPDAIYNITQKAENSGYYTLNKTTAKADDTITATLTEAGVQWLQTHPTENAVFTYEGGLHVILFPPKFTQQANGNWTASLTMPACDIVTDVIFGTKEKAVIEGTDKVVTYDGNPHRIDENIKASWGKYDISAALQDQYEVVYKGIDGTDYNSTDAPTDAGTYECTVKISKDNMNYECDPITLKLTIKKAAMKTPDAPTATAAGIGANTITLTPPTTFTDGTQIPESCGFEYRLGDGEWQDSAVFAGLLPDTDYHFYVRVKEGRNTEASEVSEVLDARTKTASEPVDPDKPNPDDPNPDKPNPDEPNPDNPTPSKPGTSSGSSDDSSDSGEPAAATRNHSEGTWKKDQTGWWYELPGGRYVSGSHVTDLVSGTQSEQVAWRRIGGAWWAFGADGYLKNGWIWDAAAGKWYYVDEKRGMLTGWYQDPQDGRWYYLDLTTGEMLTGWQLIPGWGYMYLNPFAEAQTWFYDEASGMWIYDTENTRRPYGSLYMNEKTPDGYFVDENGVWKEN